MMDKRELETVPVGYKQTEVGVIPEDWEVAEFGQLFEKNINRKSFNGRDQVAFIGMQDVSETAQIINQHLRDYDLVKSGFTYFEENDVLVAKITPCFENGKGAIVDNLIAPIGFGSTEFHVLRAVENADPKFIYYWSVNKHLREVLESEMVGSAGHRRIPLSALKKYLIGKPLFKEQTAIANALSDVDALIAELEQLIAKKEAIKTGAMQQLLTGKTRLPQFAYHADGTKKGYKPSELGEVPEDWERFTLGALSEVRMCKRILSYQTSKAGDVPFYKIGTFGGIPDAFISKTLYEEFKRKYSYPTTGDILLSAAGTIGKSVVYDGQKAYFQDSNIVWLDVDKNKLSNNYLYHYYQNIKWASPEGSTISRLYNGIIKSTDIVLPSLDEQAAIAEILSDMDLEIEALENRLEKTKALKQGMMQELLTGRTRLV